MHEREASLVAVLGGFAAAILARVKHPKGKACSGQKQASEACNKKAKKADAVKVEAKEGGQLPVGAPAEPLHILYEELCQAFAEEKALGFTIDNSQDPESFARLDAKVRKLLSGYVAAGHADYRGYCHFCPDHYVRNLVEVNDDFELMVLCWQKGQGSRVHNHANSHGWLTPLSGEMVEHRYKAADVSSDHPADAPPLPGVLGATAPCPNLSHVAALRAGPGAVAYISDKDALHSVRCPDDCPTEEGGVTLHLYAPPIRRVNLYEPENDRVVRRTPGFFSVRGRRLETQEQQQQQQ